MKRKSNMKEEQEWKKRVITEQMAQSIERTSNNWVKFRNIEFTILATNVSFVSTPKDYTWIFHKFDKEDGHGCTLTFIKFKLKESWIDEGILLSEGFTIFYHNTFQEFPVNVKKHLKWECEILIKN